MRGNRRGEHIVLHGAHTFAHGTAHQLEPSKEGLEPSPDEVAHRAWRLQWRDLKYLKSLYESILANSASTFLPDPAQTRANFEEKRDAINVRLDDVSQLNRAGIGGGQVGPPKNVEIIKAAESILRAHVRRDVNGDGNLQDYRLDSILWRLASGPVHAMPSASLNLTEFSPHPDSGDVLRCNENLVTAIADEVTSLAVPAINLYRARAG